jgi:hypothetical protein
LSPLTGIPSIINKGSTFPPIEFAPLNTTLALAPGCPELTEISRPATCPDKVCIKLALGLFSIVAAETFTCETRLLFATVP